MDGNNMDNNSQNQTGSGSQYTNYQDNTANIPYQVPIENVPDNRANGPQIAGLVCGILAICTSCCYGIPGIILGIAGLVCAIIGNKTSKNGVGIAGLVCSIIGIILGVVMLIYFIWVIANIATLGTDMGYWELLEQMGY